MFQNLALRKFVSRAASSSQEIPICHVTWERGGDLKLIPFLAARLACKPKPNFSCWGLGKTILIIFKGTVGSKKQKRGKGWWLRLIFQGCFSPIGNWVCAYSTVCNATQLSSKARVVSSGYNAPVEFALKCWRKTLFCLSFHLLLMCTLARVVTLRR